MSKVRIIPAQGGKTQGTKVVLEDGSEISGVTKVTLVANVNSLWECQLEVLALPEEIEAVLTEVKVVRPEDGDVTDLLSTSREFAPPDGP